METKHIQRWLNYWVNARMVDCHGPRDLESYTSPTKGITHA